MDAKRQLTRRDAIARILALGAGGIGTVALGASLLAQRGPGFVKTNEIDPLAILKNPSSLQTITSPSTAPGLRIQANASNTFFSVLELPDPVLQNGFKFYPATPELTAVVLGTGTVGILALEKSASAWGSGSPGPAEAVLSYDPSGTSGYLSDSLIFGSSSSFGITLANLVFLVDQTTGQIEFAGPKAIFGISSAFNFGSNIVAQGWDLGTLGNLTTIDLGNPPIPLVSSAGFGITPAQIGLPTGIGGIAAGWNRPDHRHAFSGRFYLSGFFANALATVPAKFLRFTIANNFTLRRVTAFAQNAPVGGSDSFGVVNGAGTLQGSQVTLAAGSQEAEQTQTTNLLANTAYYLAETATTAVTQAVGINVAIEYTMNV